MTDDTERMVARLRELYLPFADVPRCVNDFVDQVNAERHEAAALLTKERERRSLAETTGDESIRRAALKWQAVAESAEAEAKRLREALAKLLRETNNIEVLGEWEALDINYSSRKRVRAQVDAVKEVARAALKS